MATDQFLWRHIGPRPEDIDAMLQVVGVKSVDELIEQTVPESIRLKELIDLPAPMTEWEFFAHMKKVASKNKLYRTFIGQGYYDTITPAVIQRNILENPAWYTSYTPYQAEVSQGRLEALLNFQTLPYLPESKGEPLQPEWALTPTLVPGSSLFSSKGR